MKEIDDFFQFEINNQLFDIIDKDGHRPWDAVRYYVFSRLMTSNSVHHVSHGMVPKRKRIWHGIRMIWRMVTHVLLHRHCDYMFMLCSRDKRDGIYFDKISDSLFTLVDKSKTFALESVWHFKDYKYKEYSCPNVIVPVAMTLPFWKCRYNFCLIHSKLIEKYPNFSMDIEEMEHYYHIFKIQYQFYKFLFHHCGIKQLFMVQDGIQKGLLAAAQENGVQVFEFQHGQISRNHPAYSYPDNEKCLKEKIYHPAKLLTLGPFWHLNRVYPGVENVVIGNDSYSDNEVLSNTNGNKNILIVSNMGEGELLARQVKDILTIDQGFHFIFKLHPNQYEEKDYYIELFNNFPQVEVKTSEITIGQILNMVEGVLLVQSTIELEALRAGRKVYILREGAYEVMDFVFKENGVYLVDGAKEFVECYLAHKDETLCPRSDLFVPFKKGIAQKLILNYGFN